MCRLNCLPTRKMRATRCTICLMTRAIPGEEGATTWSYIQNVGRRTSFGCAGWIERLLRSVGLGLSYRPVSGMKKLLWLFLAPASATPLLAQSPAPALPDLPRTRTVLDAMIAAGPIMIPLFILSIISVMLVIVYFMTIRRGAIVSRGFMATADALLRKRDYLGLLAVSNRHGEAIARVVQQVLDFTTKNPNADFEQVREIAETDG